MNLQRYTGVTLCGIQRIDATVAVVVSSNPHLVSQLESDTSPAEGNILSAPQVHLAAEVKHQGLDTNTRQNQLLKRTPSKHQATGGSTGGCRPQRSPGGRQWGWRPRPARAAPVCSPPACTHSWTPPRLAHRARPPLLRWLL